MGTEQPISSIPSKSAFANFSGTCAPPKINYTTNNTNVYNNCNIFGGQTFPALGKYTGLSSIGNFYNSMPYPSGGFDYGSRNTQMRYMDTLNIYNSGSFSPFAQHSGASSLSWMGGGSGMPYYSGGQCFMRPTDSFMAYSNANVFNMQASRSDVAFDRLGYSKASGKTDFGDYMLGKAFGAMDLLLPFS